MNSKRLVETHLHMVEVVVNEFLTRTPYRGYKDLTEDLYCVGCISLIEASKKFDPTRGILFRTYASDYIRHKIHKEIIQYAKQRQVEVSIDSMVYRDANQALSTPDFTLKLFEEEEDEGLDVIEFLEPEDALEKEVYKSHLLEGEGVKRLSKRLHKAHQTIRKVKAKLLSEFKIKLERELN